MIGLRSLGGWIVWGSGAGGRRGAAPGRVVQAGWWTKWRFGSVRREQAYRRLGALVARDFQMVDGLWMLAAQASDDGRRSGDPSAQAFIAWAELGRGGSTWAASMRGWIPVSHVLLIDAGEKSSTLATSFELCAFLERSRREMVELVIATFRYPAISFLGVLGVLWIFGNFILVQFAQTLPIEKWEGLPAAVAWAYGVLSSGVFFIAVLVAAGLGGVIVYQLPRWDSSWRRLVDWMQPFSTYRVFQGTMFLLALGAMLRAGRHDRVALSMLERTAQPWLRRKIERISFEMSVNGRGLGDAMWVADSQFPSRFVVREIRMLAALGEFEGAIEGLSRGWIEQAKTKLQTSARVWAGVATAANLGSLVLIVGGSVELGGQIAGEAANLVGF